MTPQVPHLTREALTIQPSAVDTLTLSLVWRDYPSGDASVYLADMMDVGSVMFMSKARCWCAMGANLSGHRSTGHPDKPTAQAALIEALKAAAA